MKKNAKNFLVSTANYALRYNGVLACTGTTNLNSSIEVSMQEQNINGGKGNKLVYSYKYGRELNVTLENADWKLEYLAANVGSKITEGLTDIYKLGECVQIINGVGVLPTLPIGDVGVEFNDGLIVTVIPDGTTIDLTKFGVTNETVKVTYQYNRIAKSLIIDADTAPNVYELILDIDKHNNNIGKVGSVQVVIPSYQPSGNFTMNFTPDGVTSTNIDGKALAVEGDTCADGSSVYAYVKEFDDTAKAMSILEIAATPATLELNSKDSQAISVIGLKGAMYSPIQLENESCTFVSDDSTIATVDESGVVTAVSSGPTFISITYDGHEDTIDVIVDGKTTPNLMDTKVLTVHAINETVLGKSVGDLIGNDITVLANGSVTGTLKHVTDFIDFNATDVNEQSGYYFPFKLVQTGTKMSIKKNGVSRPDKTNMTFDPEILLRVEDNNTTFTIEVDGTNVVTLNFKKIIFE